MISNSIVPEGAGAEAGDDGEIEADIEDGAADRATAHLALEVLQGGHEEFGIVPAGGEGWPGCALAGGRGHGCRLLGFGGCWGGLGFWRAGAAVDEVDVAAGGGAGEQHALQGGGAQEAAVQVGEDGGEVGGAEACGDGVEVGGGGAVADGVDEVAAVAEQDADGVEDDGRCCWAGWWRRDPAGDREGSWLGSVADPIVVV